MRIFIQLRENIGFAVLRSENEPDHSVTPDHTTAIEVFTEDPDQFLKMKYDPATNSWSEAPLIRVAEIDEKGNVIEIKRTVFTHEIDEDTILMPDEITHMDKYIDGKWEIYVPPTIPEPIIEPEPTEEELAELKRQGQEWEQAQKVEQAKLVAIELKKLMDADTK